MTTPGTSVPSPVPPSWPHCALGAGSANPASCHGRRVEPYENCLTHLSETDRTAYLASLAPGSNLDHRGTALTSELLDELLNALRDPTTTRPRMGSADFSEATFIGDVGFENTMFTSRAWFSGATFSGAAQFGRVTFSGTAGFRRAKFTGRAGFEEARFTDRALFGEAKFASAARFRRVTFSGEAEFRMAKFTGRAGFEKARFTDRALFGGATFASAARFFSTTFEATPQLGPMVCQEQLDLSEVVFEVPVTIEAAAEYLVCRRTRWASTAALRLRHATVDLSDAVLESPVSVAAHSRPFTLHNGIEMAEPDMADSQVRVTSLRGVDAAHLVLNGIDLSDCRFAGTIHLDQLRLEGRYRLAAAPAGIGRHGVWPVRWTPRRTLAEEHYWRATRYVGADGWSPVPEGEEVLVPAALAPVYRQLRKAFEDGKHEPGAADFYYGEMEMRRHADDIPWGERSLLTLYWVLSGYGLRASRALGWLLVAMTATVLAMMLWGLPQSDAKPTSTGALTGRSITMTTDTPDPVNPQGPYSKRLTTERFDKSLRVVLNSVIFRSSGQDLTTAGTYTEMASRLTEPVLLGLAVLGIRGRIKR